MTPPTEPTFAFYQTTRFAKWVRKHRLESSVETLKAEVQENPDAGDVIPGGDGLRKIRMAGQGRGKSGGFRVVYALILSRTAAILFDGYSKSAKEDLSDEQLKSLVIELGGMRAQAGSPEPENQE